MKLDELVGKVAIRTKPLPKSFSFMAGGDDDAYCRWPVLVVEKANDLFFVVTLATKDCKAEHVPASYCDNYWTEFPERHLDDRFTENKKKYEAQYNLTSVKQ